MPVRAACACVCECARFMCMRVLALGRASFGTFFLCWNIHVNVTPFNIYFYSSAVIISVQSSDTVCQTQTHTASLSTSSVLNSKPCRDTASAPPPTAAVRHVLMHSSISSISSIGSSTATNNSELLSSKLYPLSTALSSCHYLVSKRAIEVFYFIGAIRSGITFSVQQQQYSNKLHVCIGSHTETPVFSVHSFQLLEY